MKNPALERGQKGIPAKEYSPTFEEIAKKYPNAPKVSFWRQWLNPFTQEWETINGGSNGSIEAHREFDSLDYAGVIRYIEPTKPQNVLCEFRCNGKKHPLESDFKHFSHYYRVIPSILDGERVKSISVAVISYTGAHNSHVPTDRHYDVTLTSGRKVSSITETEFNQLKKWFPDIPVSYGGREVPGGYSW